MRTLGAASAFLVLVLASTPAALGLTGKPSRIHRGHVGTLETPAQRAAKILRKHVVVPATPARPTGARRLLSALELDVVARINAQRRSRGLRALRVSRGLTFAANYHTHQMGQLGFFEHESVNGAPFWRRIQRFYPSRRLLVGWREHLLGVARLEGRDGRPRVDAQPAAPPEHPHARVA